MFPGRFVSRFGDMRWSPRSPDFTVCDIFLWGYHRSRVYETKNLAHLTNLKTRCDCINRRKLASARTLIWTDFLRATNEMDVICSMLFLNRKMALIYVP